MSAGFTRKYNTAATIDGIALRTAGTGDIRANPTLASGDVKISKDGGAFANLTNLPTATPAAGKNVQMALTATELSCARAVIHFIDQTATKEWDDFEVVVETFGNASATFPPDYSDSQRLGLVALPAASTLTVTPTLNSTQAFNNTGQTSKMPTTLEVDAGTAQAGGATTITLRSGANATDDFYNRKLVVIVSGTGAGQSNTITDYVGSTKVATVANAWATNPDNTSVYAVLGVAGAVTGQMSALLGVP